MRSRHGDYTGGEFLLADYLGFGRLARLRPVAMPGGAQAVRQPWRNLYALLLDAIGWAGLTARFSALDLHACLDGKPRALLDAMIAQQMNAPPRSAVLRRSICRAP
jgi:hydrogenase maturation protein HypF